MNFIDKFFLWLVFLPTGLYRRFGVDINQLKAILTAKLTMDNRRPAAFGQGRRNSEKKEVSKSTLGTFFGALMMGLMMLFAFAMIDVDMQSRLTVFFSMFIFMLCMTLISDFTSVLIDIRDNLILLPKPVSDATFMISRLLHITIRTSIIVIPMTLPALILLIFLQGGLIVLPFILMVILSTLLSIFFINAIYLLILKITTPARFQSIIGSIQIAFVMLIMVGYQIIPRMMESDAIRKISIQDNPVAAAFPAYWMADACLLLSGQVHNGLSWMNLALSVLVPLLSIWLVVRFFAPSFNQKLGMITGSTSEQRSPAAVRRGGRFIERLARIFTRPGAEFGGFVFSARMMSRSKDFKLKVYPSIGYLIVMSVFFLLKNNAFDAVSHGSKPAPILFVIMYFSSIVTGGIFFQMPYSEKYKASWLFQVAPLTKPGQFLGGAVKCVLVCTIIPILIVLTSLGVVLQGGAVIPNVLLGCVNLILITLIIAYIALREIPFSKSQDEATKGGTFIRSMLMLIAPGILGLIHYAISGMLPVVVILTLIDAVAAWLVYDEITKRGWDKIG